MKQLRKNSEYGFLALVLILTMHYAVAVADDDEVKPADERTKPKKTVEHNPDPPDSTATGATPDRFAATKPAASKPSTAQPPAGTQPAVITPQQKVKAIIDKLPPNEARAVVEYILQPEKSPKDLSPVEKAFREDLRLQVESITDQEEKKKFSESLISSVNQRVEAQNKADAEKQTSAAKKAEEEKKLADQRRLEEQQALQNAFLQGASRGAQEQAARSGQNGAGGSGSGGSGNGSGKGAIQPKSDSPSSPKTEGIGDALDKFKHGNDKQNQSISETRGLLQNQGNFGSGDLKTGSEKNKEDGKSPFDISPKTPKNDETKTSKKEGEVAGAGADSAAVDPGALALNNGNQNIILSGPTSVPQLAPPTGGGEVPSGGDGDGGGGGGTPPIKGGPGGGGGGDSGFLGGGDPFKSVGSMEYPELPPPIRKIPFESGGGGDGGGSSGSTEGTAENNESSTAATKNDKKASLLNELVLTSDNPRVRGLGIMAYVGVQTTDLCGRPEAKGVGVCRKRFDMKLEEKLRLRVSPVSASVEEAK